MVVSVQRYQLDDFNRLMFEGFEYELDASVIDTIQVLSDQVGAPEYVRTPQFPKNDRRYESASVTKGGKYRNKTGGHSDDDWKTFRQFQVTQIVKKEGIDGAIDSIRKHLNKISEKNYEKLRGNIFDELREVVGSDGDDVSETVLEECKKVGDAIFSIASGNMFYSEIYARLYKELMQNFLLMETIFQNNLEQFRGIFTTIEYCDSDEDYDKFCANNKENEKRRAIGAFYVNLMKIGVVSRDEIISIIGHLQDYLTEKISEQDNKHVVDELSEVVAIMLLNAIPAFKSDDSISDLNELIERVNVITKMKISDYPSITSKSIFRHMDIMDGISS
tara:strand:- start:630 stop:1628 length:999 start_codon:yes stop_codon:yes gene_type:complete